MTALAVKSLPCMLFGKSPNNQFIQMKLTFDTACPMTTVQWDFSLSVLVFYMHIVFLAGAWGFGKIQAELPFSLLSLDR